MAEPTEAAEPGARLIQADLVGTAAFVITAVVAAALFRPGVQAIAVAVSGALFVGGCGAFAWGFLIAVQRSRTEAIELSSLFFLKESAPPRTRRALLLLVAVQVVAAVVTASVRTYTSLAFGVIAPVWGLGLITLWSGRYGRFPPKRTAATVPTAVVSDPVDRDEQPDQLAAPVPAIRRVQDEAATRQQRGNPARGGDRPE